ncbi:MAG: DNA adenine methylase, partial [Sphaerospermopsis kisseleviana]
MIKSPLRYPGGKSRAIKQIAQHLPTQFTEFREPLVGGGSVFIYLKQT